MTTNLSSQPRTFLLSPMQQGMLFHYLKEPQAGVDIEQLVIHLPERIDADRLRSAWNWLIQRHDVLRARFDWQTGSAPRLEILPELNVPFLVKFELETEPTKRSERLDDFLHHDRLAGFPMNQAPLLRLTLFAWTENLFTLVWTFHHALLDGRSFTLLLREAFEAYEELATGEIDLRPAPPPYGRYLSWIQAKDHGSSDFFWQKMLGGLTLPTPLPIEGTGSGSEESAKLGETWGAIDQKTTAQIHALAIASGVSTNTIVMAAWAVLLHRYSGEEDIVFGATRACRKSSVPDADVTVGLFINTLPVRVALGAETKLKVLFKNIREQWIAMRPHEHTPLARIRGLSQIPPSQSLFKTLVVFENARLDQSTRSLGGKWTGRTVDLHELTNFSLTLAAYDGDELTFKIEFSRQNIPEDSVARLVGHLETILGGMARQSAETVGELTLLPQAEYTEIVTTWNATSRSFPRDLCLHDLIVAQAEKTPHAPAVSFNDQTITYSELNNKTNQLANYLLSAGAGPDRLIGVCMERSMEMVIALLGILKSGSAYVPIDPNYPQDRVAYMIKDAGASIILTQQKLLPGLSYSDARLIALDSAWPDIDAASAEQPKPRVGPENLAYMIYTSGSTGRPKGALNAHAGIVNRLLWMQAEYHLTSSDSVLQKTPFSFDVSVWEFFWPLLAGARLVVATPGGHQDPEYLAHLIVAEKITLLHFVPSMLRAFLTTPLVQRCHSLRDVICSGEALPADLVDDFHRTLPARLHNLYGPTEAAVDVTYWPCERGVHRTSIPIGRPVANTQCYILDPQLRPVPPWIAGELYLGGIQVGRGYHRQPELTAKSFIRDHFQSGLDARLYKTGDLCRYTSDGVIEYLGRIDHQVKIRGFRIELGEIDAVLAQHPEVREAIVHAREDGSGNKQLVAYIVAEGTPPASQILREFIKSRLPEHMVPAAFVFLDRLPLSANGKIDRKALPAPEFDHSAHDERFVAPVTPAEKQLAEIWSKVLRLDRVGITHNFFELGGDSILSIQIISLARQAGMNLNLKLLFLHQTIQQLAAVAPPMAQAAPNEQGMADGTAPLTPIQHWFFEQQLDEPHYFNQAFLFSTKVPLELEALAKALSELERHHDALRIRFSSSLKPQEQTFAATTAFSSFENLDFSSVSDVDLPTAIEKAAVQVQSNLNFVTGPLWRAVYFDLGGARPPRLLLAIHHLAVDGVSWRLLLEDLERGYTQARAQKEIQLPPKTTSVKAWAKKLAALADHEAIPGGTQHWTKGANSPITPLPVDFNAGANIESSTQTITVHLDAAETEALLQKAPAAYNTQINDLLLAALTKSLAEWGGSDHVTINLEGHGREDLGDELDLSRTVGWFTTLFPVRLQRPQGGIADLIKSVKEQLRAVPARGIGYGLQRYLARDAKLAVSAEPEVVFNYLGQFDQVVSESQLFEFAPESPGPWHSPKQHRRHLLEINCMVVRERLEIAWTSSLHRHRPATIERIAANFVRDLREILQACIQTGTRGITPSDFPLAALDQPGLDGLLAQAPDLEDVYPLTPVQTLFYSVGAQDPREVTDQWHCTLTGPLNPEKFYESWQRLVARHAVLRSSFHAPARHEPVQVVHRAVKLPWSLEDWRTLPTGEQQARWMTLLETERNQGLDLDRAPLHRLKLVRLTENQYKFLWIVPALLLDGWSWPLVFRDLSNIYRSLQVTESPSPAPVRPYRDYVAWLAQRKKPDDENFWRTRLKGITEPTPLLSELGELPRAGSRQSGHCMETLDEATAARLISTARQLHVTPGTLIMTAWSLVLARLSERNDVVFGAAFSGRPADLPDSGNIVGTFSHNLPVRVKPGENQTLNDLIKKLQTSLLDLDPHQFAPLEQIQSWSDVPWRDRLFESLVVVQNYEVGEAAQRLGHDVVIEDFSGPIHTPFPLLVLVEPSVNWRITLIHDRRVLAAPRVAQWTRDLVNVLTLLPDTLDLPGMQIATGLSSPAAATVAKPRFKVRSLNYLPPQTDIQRTIAKVWESLFQMEKIGIEENLFDLGAHSILVTRLHQRLRTELNRKFPLVSLFQYPTISSLAQHFEADKKDVSAGQIQSRAQQQRQALARLRRPAAKP